MNPEKPSTTGVFHWVDTPWVVAALLGLWGVMIGIEAFFAADMAASAAAILVAAALGRETLIWTRRRRTVPFLVGLLLVLVTLGADFWWTGEENTSSEAKNAQLAKLDQIPPLQKTIQTMTANEQQTAKDQAVAQGKLEQKFNDIGDDNKRLKTSIEQKDATLAKIALDQYALNFTPQVTPYIQDKPEEIFFQNNGKTNVTLSSMSCQQIAVTPTDNGTPAVLAPGTSVSILLNDIAKQVILNDAATNADVERKVEFPCQITIATLDNKMYILKFTWTFAVKASVISRSFTITQQITAKP